MMFVRALPLMLLAFIETGSCDERDRCKDCLTEGFKIVKYMEKGTTLAEIIQKAINEIDFCKHHGAMALAWSPFYLDFPSAVPIFIPSCAELERMSEDILGLLKGTIRNILNYEDSSKDIFCRDPTFVNQMCVEIQDNIRAQLSTRFHNMDVANLEYFSGNHFTLRYNDLFYYDSKEMEVRFDGRLTNNTIFLSSPSLYNPVWRTLSRKSAVVNGVKVIETAYWYIRLIEGEYSIHAFAPDGSTLHVRITKRTNPSPKSRVSVHPLHFRVEYVTARRP